MGLARYKEKRDFSKTPEPAGAARPRRAKALRYVIQKHAARRLHYDFRLEMEGVLRSWAVPKGPSLDPADKRYAAHVEDHPLEYGGFEGVIPEGQYGAGPVAIWDRGTWIPKGDPVKDYRRGRLEFQLEGERLKGWFILIRMQGEGKTDKDWLLIKMKDEEARPGKGDLVTRRGPDSVVSKRDLDDILAKPRREWTREGERKPQKEQKRTVRAAAAVATPTRRRPAARRARVELSEVEGARRASLAETMSPELATLVDAAPEGDEWIHEIKFDGYRLLCRIEDGEARLVTRHGKDWTDRFPSVAGAAVKLPVTTAMLDGEIVALLPDGSTSFQALQNSMSTGDGHELTYYVFDLLHLDGFDLTRATLLDRKRVLEQLLADVAPPIRYSDHVQGHGARFFAVACRRRLEGILSKRADSTYSGRRGRNWVKTKCKSGQEVVIVGYTDPEGSREALGALLVGIHDANGRLVYAGKVGTGYTAQTLRELHAKLASLERQEPSVVEPPRGYRARGFHWVEPKLVCEVAFTEWTSDGRLRHPSYKGLRADKPPEEIVREKPQDPPEEEQQTPRPPAAVRTKPSRSTKDRVEVAGVAISHPDRVLYPEQGLTKLEVARFYESIADWILPELRDRPLTLVRCPDGRAGQCFYQKHVGASVPDTVLRVPIAEKGPVQDYLAVDSLEGLIGLVQIGVLEFHVWGSRRQRLEQPDRVVFDLDPDPSVGWDDVVRAAHRVREKLEAFELATFVKTTGGKGIHVVLPLTPRAGQEWDVVKDFSHRVVDTLVAEEPERYTSNLLKAKRKGRVFLDYLRNGRGATAVVAYSTRAKPGAPVSTPITWKELDEGVRADAFNVKNLVERLAKLRRDPWADIGSVRQSITAAMRRSLGMK